MRLRLAPALAVLSLLACARAQHPRRSPIANVAPSAPALVDEPARSPPPEPEPEPPPADPFAGITGDVAVGFAGEEALLRESPAAVVEVAALDVACLRGDEALRDPAKLDARLADVARAQGIAVGRLRFVRLESDPSRARGGSPPRLCRPVQQDATLYAPLFREREPASSWLLSAVEGGEVRRALDDVLAALARSGKAVLAPPRIVVVRGRLVAAAVPVAP